MKCLFGGIPGDVEEGIAPKPSELSHHRTQSTTSAPLNRPFIIDGLKGVQLRNVEEAQPLESQRGTGKGGMQTMIRADL
jgi:hypothetical protein